MERRQGDVPTVTERAGRERPVSQRQAALVQQTASAVYHQLDEPLDHAVRLRPIRRAREMKHQLAGCRTLQLGSVVAVEKVKLILSIELP